MLGKSINLPTAEDALPGRSQAIEISAQHYVHGRSMLEPFPDDCESIIFGMGCFWGVERKFWPLQGVYSTAVGYSGGITLNPSYQEVCTGLTGHNETVLVIYQPAIISIEQLLKVFWESHDPTQGMRQGNDKGTQYRSGIYYKNDTQLQAALKTRERYQQAIAEQGYSQITTEILAAGPFYYAEEYHQQYLAKNPQGYCGLGGTGIACL
jgi:peptide-methionine (S)-S-oxide reductase